MQSVWNTRLDELQAGIKIAGRNINNFSYVNGIILMSESKEETKERLDEGEGGEWKSWLKTKYLKKTKIMASGPIQFSSVQSLSRVRLFMTPWIAAC